MEEPTTRHRARATFVLVTIVPYEPAGVTTDRVAIGVRHCSSNSGVGEASNLDSAMVGGGSDHSSVGLTSQNLADGVRVGLTSDSSHQGNNNEGFHIEASLADCRR